MLTATLVTPALSLCERMYRQCASWPLTAHTGGPTALGGEVGHGRQGKAWFPGSQEQKQGVTESEKLLEPCPSTAGSLHLCGVCPPGKGGLPRGLASPHPLLGQTALQPSLAYRTLTSSRPMLVQQG